MFTVPPPSPAAGRCPGTKDHPRGRLVAHAGELEADRAVPAEELHGHAVL